MHMAGIALCSSSPPAAVWSTQCSLSTSSCSHVDIDPHGRPAYNLNSATRPVVGGLSGLFANSRLSPQAPCSVGDGLESSSFVCTSGMARSSSQDNLSYNVGAWDCIESRGGSVSVPVGSSFRLWERSPVSVLHPPVSRSSHQNPLVSPLIAWDSSVSTPGFPPLDPHLDRHSRRKGFLSVDERRPISRSVGFEVGSDGYLIGYHARLRSADSSATSSNSPSPEDEARKLDQYFLMKDVLGPGPPTDAPLNKMNAERQELQEARRRLSRLAEGFSRASSFRTSNLPLSAEELLVDAQERNAIFSDALVIKAFGVAEQAHRGQVRRSGGLYLSHCVETAILLADTGADSTVVAAGLLHDVLDDSSLDHEQLRFLFGGEVEHLVSGVSKLSTFSQLARDNEIAGKPEEADRLSTMFLAMVDVRVVLIKLADRLHNLRTLDALPAVKQLRIAEETSEIFAPLANRLGIWSWKAEMEDICFKHLKPQEYEELASKMAAGWQQGVVVSSIQQLQDALRKNGVEFTDICGRPKNLYSIYSKMIRKGRSIDEIFDVRGLRLVVQNKESCYAALEVVHSLWSHSPQKFKDYITCPKANGYQSLHTVVWGEDGHPLEVQIRTIDMHHQAEYGTAAHWRYKEDNSKHSSFLLQMVEWARWVLTWHSEILDTKIRVSPLEADLRPPCPFPFHKEDCPFADLCSPPPQSEDDPLFVIMLKDHNMIVKELAPGSTAGDLLVASLTDHRDSISVSGKRTTREEGSWPKVNHQFVDNLQQKLKMGDLVEVILEAQVQPVMVPLSNRQSELTQAQIASLSPIDDRPCGRIALEFQREQLKRLYHDVSSNEDVRRGPPTPQEKNASVASLS